LPPLEAGEYYWTDLEGLTVRNTAGQVLGSVERLLETGANDVLVLDGGRDRLIPFVAGQVVLNVDLEAGEIEVDWEASYWE
jgi:16S rRNA processing protein RimM